jgi:DNA-binding LacI/PurR family transcriptional regulator
MRDVADRAGVSTKTVSNVVNGYQHVSIATRTRVQLALDELGYEMNVAARHLRSGRTGIIALALPELGQPYFAELAEEIVRYAEKRNLTVLIEQTGGIDADRERQVLTGTRRHLVDGLIFSPLALEPEELRNVHTDFPVVLLGERVFGGNLDHVSIDNVPAARAATEHLISLGHRRIAALGRVPEQRLGTASLRLLGYAQALEAAGMEARDVVVTHRWHRDAGAAAAEAVLARPGPLPDAIFCLNDTLALGALRTLLRAGVRVPDDVALMGFDDLEETRFSFPALSTVAPGLCEIAQVSIDLLEHRMAVGPVVAGATDHSGPQERFAGFRLVIRESTGGPRAAARIPQPASEAVLEPASTPARSTSRERYVSPGRRTVDG